MNWQRYKKICDRPDVFSRWMLEQTRELTDTALADALGEALEALPVPKPPDHGGGRATDMIPLALGLEQLTAISESVAAAVAAGATTSATRDRGLGGFREAWQECVEHRKRGS